MRRPASIRVRVAIAATLAVGLVLVAGGVLTLASFADREHSSLDRELEQRAAGPARRAVLLPAGRPGIREGFRVERAGRSGIRERFRDERALRHPRPGRGAMEVPPPGGLLAESGSFVRVVGSGREVVQQAGDVPGSGFPRPAKPGFATVEQNGRRWRTFTAEAPVALPEVGEAGGSFRPLIQFAADLAPVEDRISEMRTRVIVISALGILLSALLASLLSGAALEPLSRLRRAVAGVSSTRDLSRRLPEDGAAPEVSELARSVNGMLIRLERSAGATEAALGATRRFASDVGHEIRTPLTSIRANVDALRRNPSMSDAEQRVILEEIAAEQDELVALLDALQALARGDAAAAVPREQLDLAEVLDAAVATARRRHPEATIELHAPDGRLPLEGWADGLEMLADNLLENAVRHGGRRVEVELRPAAGDAILIVQDDGPGVPVEERTHIFERFARGSGARTSGSGLGLALVAQESALHGGNVEVGDSALGGASFTVRLSLDAEAARSAKGDTSGS